MNYEEFYTEAQVLTKAMNDASKAVGKLSKAVEKDLKEGNIKDAQKIAGQYADALAKEQEAAKALSEKVSGFDAAGYFTDGEFVQQLLDACRERGVDVHGEAPVYEMFPYKVRIDAENQDLYLNRKKVPSMRPTYFADMIRTNQEKLKKANFNAASFAEDLAAAYDVTVLKASGNKAGKPLMLTTVYKNLVPMPRLRREYDMMAFSYDLSRLYQENLANPVHTKDGRAVELGTGREGANAIRFLDAAGEEHYMATVRFYKD